MRKFNEYLLYNKLQQSVNHTFAIAYFTVHYSRNNSKVIYFEVRNQERGGLRKTK